MLKKLALLALAATLCSGATCTIDFDGDGIDGSPTLNDLYATLMIQELAGSNNADARIEITTAIGRTIVLEDGQSISVNDEELVGPVSGGYEATVVASPAYVIAVYEPTRGVAQTTVSTAGGFAFTAPVAGDTVSLSGFTLTWSGANAAFDAQITVTQTLFGQVITASLDPATDTGTHTFTLSDLTNFRQGAPLLITLTRTNERDLEGFREGTVRVQYAATLSVNPGP
ncbi:MAG: hypothetical protein PVJ57_07340 [Phycisphaerae bacterium]|jgi:hypothetical protein